MGNCSWILQHEIPMEPDTRCFFILMLVIKPIMHLPPLICSALEVKKQATFCFRRILYLNVFKRRDEAPESPGGVFGFHSCQSSWVYLCVNLLEIHKDWWIFGLISASISPAMVWCLNVNFLGMEGALPEPHRICITTELGKRSWKSVFCRIAQYFDNWGV